MRIRRPYRVRRRKSIVKNRFFWISIFILVIIGIFFYFVFFAQIFQIKGFQISGNEKVQKGDLEILLLEKVNRKIVTFPTESIFLVNLPDIEKTILEKFPQISQVHLKREFPDALTLDTRERKPLYIFCKNSGPCFSLDEKRIIFEEVSGMEELFLKIKDMKTQEIKLGGNVVTEELLNGIREIEVKLKEKVEIPLKEVILFEEKIEVQTVQDFKIFFNPKENISRQIQKLILTLENEIPKEKRENLEYIDLRFGSKVYYKYRQ